jgi:hypothetical protein
MNSGQQLLTIFAITLLTILAINVYRSSGSRSDTNLYDEAIITGTGIGQSMLNEVDSKAFDETTVLKSVSTPDSLTPPLSLGPDAGEVLSTEYDDIDDYNNFVRTDSLSRLGVFKTSVKVYYIAKMSPSVKSSSPTFTKEIDIYVTNFSLPDTLKFNRIISY